ncbi:MAG: RlpA-like double-psi beta-barrel-protein domain-containing protein-containing protein [Piptocephalis tieghemiana]|nr:MAG: RlpA-like double-psi beta-barrel-protein domain-containing protein-containing protein [Piptocephalis tieghemiana]
MHLSSPLGLAVVGTLVTSIAAFPSLRIIKRASGGQFQGQATFYELGLGACGSTNSEPELVAALNADQYAQAFGKGPNCNRQARITAGGKFVTVRIVDKCPTCSHGDLDLSKAAFSRLSSLDAGRVNIAWSWVS